MLDPETPVLFNLMQPIKVGSDRCRTAADGFPKPMRFRGAHGLLWLALSTQVSGAQTAAALAWQYPPAIEITYDVAAQSKGFTLQGSGELLWHPKVQSYEAKLSVAAMFFFKRAQISRGTLNAQGLTPLSFEDHKRRIESVRFVPHEKKVYYDNGTQLSWPLDGQDRVSMLVDLGRRAAQAQAQGETRVLIPINDGRRWRQWQFQIHGREMLSTPAGTFSAWRLERIDANRGSQQATLWLAPELAWMPVKLVLHEENGDVATLAVRRTKTP